MKIGVISDTHLGGVTDSLKRIVETWFHDADMILHAGDIVSGEVLAYLETCGVIAVHGNMCRPEVRDALPTKRVVRAGNFRIGLIHGYGTPNGLAARLRGEFDQIDCLVYGHSHIADNTRLDAVHYFNPGTAFMSSYGGNTIGILHVSDTIEGEIIKLD